jgi:hypothetical protein
MSSRAKPRDQLFASRFSLPAFRFPLFASRFLLFAACREPDHGELGEEVYIALECGEPESEIRARLLEKLNSLANS